MSGDGTAEAPLEITRLSPEFKARLRRYLRQLQHEFLTLHPTVLRFVDFVYGDPETWGHTVHVRGRKRETLRIDIALWLSEEAAFYVLLHEYAHAMVWRAPHQEKDRALDHDPEWGLAFAKCWALCCELDKLDLC